MNNELRVLDELETRLIATYYRGGQRRPAVPSRRVWVPATVILVLACLITGVAALLPGGGSSPAVARAALYSAANAAQQRPDVVLGPGKLWYVKSIQAWTLPMPLPPTPGQPLSGSSQRTVPIEFRTVIDDWVSPDGVMRQRTTLTLHFTKAGEAKVYSRKLQAPSVSYQTFRTKGELASPLAPVPLLSYGQLRALPSGVVALRQALALLQGRFNAYIAEHEAKQTQTQTSSTSTSSSQTTSTAVGQGQVVGSCCGSSSVDHAAVSDLNTITWLLTLPVSPKVRAGLYRTAASLPGVLYDGVVRDDLGRAGVEISIGHGSAQMRLIFDEHTGALLATTTSFGASAEASGYGQLGRTIDDEKVVSTATLPSRWR